MSENQLLMLSLTGYKVISILAGVALAYMGYKLFIHGIFSEAGELHTAWKDRRLILSKAAPGTFFALFGTLIVGVSLWRGLSLEPLGGRGVDDPAGVAGMRGSGMFADAGREARSRAGDGNRQTVLGDVASLNRFAEELLLARERDRTAPAYSVGVEDVEATLDLIDRTKLALMLSVWSEEWGDPDEFQKWARQAPGYFHGDPPASIAAAAAIFKGEIR